MTKTMDQIISELSSFKIGNRIKIWTGFEIGTRLGLNTLFLSDDDGNGMNLGGLGQRRDLSF